jgi:anti-sigma regulatory factor (Ser/Thr protein kinase)
MPDYDLVYAATLVTVAFCALMFSVLAVFFWRERRSRRWSVFAVFTLACAAAFLMNLLLTTAPGWATPVTVALDLVTGMIPALLLRLVSQGQKSRVRSVFYGASAAMAAALALDDAGLVSSPFGEQAPAILLAAASVLGLSLISVPERRQGAWYCVLLVLTLVDAVAGMIFRSPLTDLTPDYLLLGFFCVTLYYQERLIFFDLLIKRGMFFCFALATLFAFFVLRRSSDPLTAALLLTPLWLLAPWIDRRLGRFVDRVFLRRRYSEAEAERMFTGELQASSSEDDLRSRAERCLAAIFQASAELMFASGVRAKGENPHAMVADLQQQGLAKVEPRASGIPFMSDDRRLFRSLTGTLAVVLENVRFREQQQRQQEREEQLRLLASRAELKALRAQINPHFLFNALNAIAGLIPSQPKLADRTIEGLAQVFRYTLRRSESEWVRLDEEVEFVTAYMRVEQARFGERLAIEVSVEPDAEAIPVPAMCIQPLVENALRHGVSCLEGRGEVRLSCAVEGDALTIEVSDNGPGFPRGFTFATSSGHALRNIAERLRGYYGEMGKLSWDDMAGLTRVSMRIPCQAVVESPGRGKRDSYSDRRR